MGVDMSDPKENANLSESALIGATCVICEYPIRQNRCLCGTYTGNGDIVRHDPMPADELRVDELRERLPGDELARVVRRATGTSNRCEDEHTGPWVVISRHTSAAPHSQCGGCGGIDRTGKIANEMGDN